MIFFSTFSLDDIFYITGIWPRTFCFKCKKNVWTNFPKRWWGGKWRTKCRKCYSVLPGASSHSIRIGASGILSKRFQDKHRGSVPDNIKERHQGGKKNWRKLANFGGRMGFRGDGTPKI